MHYTRLRAKPTHAVTQKNRIRESTKKVTGLRAKPPYAVTQKRSRERESQKRHNSRLNRLTRLKKKIALERAQKKVTGLRAKPPHAVAQNDRVRECAKERSQDTS